ncbi:hypothetical protein GOP47_0008453 [Adiantum capillus-veneris]|uniref:Uncharacterized protein n=1 Tax=Adiantum capillus-veneris TaxID=13818 RepID=A0A9D4ZI24_ADICA|nr:hypothetical protein GOP47_0008453 [Adiantum capillus-veneris]
MEEKEQEKELQTLPKCRRSTSSSTSTCSTSSRSTLGFDDLHASFDLDILDCNICMEVLSPPIFQACEFWLYGQERFYCLHMSLSLHVHEYLGDQKIMP